MMQSFDSGSEALHPSAVTFSRDGQNIYVYYPETTVRFDWVHLCINIGSRYYDARSMSLVHGKASIDTASTTSVTARLVQYCKRATAPGVRIVMTTAVSVLA